MNVGLSLITLNVFGLTVTVYHFLLKANRIRVSTHSGRLFRWHSRIRSTLHPSDLSRLPKWLSRLMFRRIFASHHRAFVRGVRLRQLCPCQKHPSTKTATLSRCQTKSGRPGSCEPLRQPARCSLRSIDMSLNSVDAFRELRILDMIAERLIPPKVSTARSLLADRHTRDSLSCISV